MNAKEKVLATMKEAGLPLNAGKIAELSGLDRKEVDAAMKQLKAEGAIVSPVRCKGIPLQRFFYKVTKHSPHSSHARYLFVLLYAIFMEISLFFKKKSYLCTEMSDTHEY